MSHANRNPAAPAGTPTVLSYAIIPAPARWPIPYCLMFLAIAFVLQMALLPCLCNRGTMKLNFALLLDAMFLGRLILARWLGETSRGWIVYVVILMSSCIWIEFLAESDFVTQLADWMGIFR